MAVMLKSIKYYTKQVCFQEIPDEISYTYFISGCQNRCPDCHSKHLWEDVGTFVTETLAQDLSTHGKLCTCVLFMGGDDKDHVESLKLCLDLCKKAGYKTALYTGLDLDSVDKDLLLLLNYIKVGPYIKKFGGLKSPVTNQRLYKLNKLGDVIEDLTPLFRRTLDENYD
jgi:anaerobic ribonucleoside-triphosphate reductase activating protein